MKSHRNTRPRFRAIGRWAAYSWLIAVTVVVALFVFAPPAAADNCSTFGDCFGQSEAASEAALGLTALAALSLIVDFVGGRGGLGTGVLAVGRTRLGSGTSAAWERSLGMLSITPPDDVLGLLSGSFTNGPFDRLLEYVPDIGLPGQVARVDAWTRELLGDGSERVSGAVNHFFGRDMFDGQEWGDFLTTLGDGAAEISTLVPMSASQLQLMFSDPAEMNRRFRSGAGAAWGTVNELGSLAYDVQSLSMPSPALVIELHRWTQTGEHRGVALVSGLVQVADGLSSLVVLSPDGLTELTEVLVTGSIANHEGLQTGAAVVVEVIDWETFAEDPSAWFVGIAAEGRVDVLLGGGVLGAGDNIARVTSKADEAAAAAAQVDEVAAAAGKADEAATAGARTDGDTTPDGGSSTGGDETPDRSATPDGGVMTPSEAASLLTDDPEIGAELAAIIEENGDMGVQAAQDLAPARIEAASTKQTIDGVADELAERFGGQVAAAEIKDPVRALEKLIDDYSGDISRLNDLARNTIIVPESRFDDVIAELEALGAKVKIQDASETPMGFSGINAKVKTPTGVGEIQVNTPGMIYATATEVDARRMLGDQVYDDITAQVDVPGGLSHDLYEQWRALPEPFGDEGIRLIEEAKEYHAVFQALDS